MIQLLLNEIRISKGTIERTPIWQIEQIQRPRKIRRTLLIMITNEKLVAARFGFETMLAIRGQNTTAERRQLLLRFLPAFSASSAFWTVAISRGNDQNFVEQWAG